MSRRTIIFINGFAVPKFVGKTRFVWDDDFWQGYNRIHLTSAVPISDVMVSSQLTKLNKFVSQFDKPIVIGQSLGAWWAANLACHPKSNIDKMVLWTPLGDAQKYPVFNVSDYHHPVCKAPNPHNIGPHKTLVCYGERDWLVPPEEHAHNLISHFKATEYKLDGGHFFQFNHKRALSYMKDWIEL
jgi:pimeloyl-ACP methyl ester carboxylesterase